MKGLREQWRRNAMQVIQQRALDLFEERGFDAVTIEAVATAAEVSPSSVYRYFGSKEGLLVVDEFDAMSADEIAATVDPSDPIRSLLHMVRRYEVRAEDAVTRPDSWRRVPFFFSVPSVRAALLASADATGKRIAPLIAETGTFSPSQARVLASAVTFGYLATLELWFDDGQTRPIADYVEEGLEPLRALWR